MTIHFVRLSVWRICSVLYLWDFHDNLVAFFYVAIWTMNEILLWASQNILLIVCWIPISISLSKCRCCMGIIKNQVTQFINSLFASCNWKENWCCTKVGFMRKKMSHKQFHFWYPTFLVSQNLPRLPKSEDPISSQNSLIVINWTHLLNFAETY